MRKYEMVVILDPSVDERTVSGTFEKLVQVIPTEGGTIDNVDYWGKRKFAYEIDKKTEGIYIVLSFTSNPETAQELDRQLGLNESIMRTKLMRLEEQTAAAAEKAQAAEKAAAAADETAPAVDETAPAVDEK